MNQVLQIRSGLAAEQLPTPAPAWLQAVVAAQPAGQRTLPALMTAARTRLLATDLAAPGLFEAGSGACAGFPRGDGVATQERRLPHDVVVQVLDVENLALSRWQQVQTLEAIERGEQKRGREIVRVPAAGTDEADSRADGRADGRADAASVPAAASATHRLVLQDATGHTVSAIELVRIGRIGIGRLRIGEKLVLRTGTVVARDVVLLEPDKVRFLGGQVEALHKAWLDGRLARLRAEAQGQ